MSAKTLKFFGAAALAAALLFVVLTRPNRGEPPVPMIGGQFELTSQNGDRLSSNDLLGRPFAVFFGYTMCPDICPTTLMDLSGVLKDLGSAADEMRFLFISIDPERDKPEHLKQYLSNFDPRILGLTGTPAEIAAVAAAYRAYYTKVPTSSDYTMDHSTLMYLMDRRGKFSDLIKYQEAHDSQVQKFRKLVSK
jgi:protein SCO1/2